MFGIVKAFFVRHVIAGSKFFLNAKIGVNEIGKNIGETSTKKFDRKSVY